MNSNKIQVSVVIVSWNVKNLLIECIKGIYGFSDIEIIVVDNNSSDNTVDHIILNFPDVVIIQNFKNIGFANANNQGFDLATGEYIYILNPDTLCSKKSIDILVKTMDENSRVGIVGPKILLGDGTIQESCARILPTITSFFLFEILPLRKILGKKITSRYLYPYSYELPSEVEAISGAAMLIRKEIIDTFGGFSDKFIHTGEDLELNYRVRKQGYYIYYNPLSIITHFCGQSSKQAELRITVNGYLSYHKYFEITKGKMSSMTFKFLVLAIRLPLSYLFYSVKKIFGLISKSKWETHKQIFYALYKWKPL